MFGGHSADIHLSRDICQHYILLRFSALTAKIEDAYADRRAKLFEKSTFKKLKKLKNTYQVKKA